MIGVRSITTLVFAQREEDGECAQYRIGANVTSAVLLECSLLVGPTWTTHWWVHVDAGVATYPAAGNIAGTAQSSQRCSKLLFQEHNNYRTNNDPWKVQGTIRQHRAMPKNLLCCHPCKLWPCILRCKGVLIPIVRALKRLVSLLDGWICEARIKLRQFNTCGVRQSHNWRGTKNW